MPEPWFRPKVYGYGATPKNWKGWAATAVYTFVVFGLCGVMLKMLDNPDPVLIALWAAMVLLFTGAFVALARMRTEGKWKWHWGN
jgi:uncharacterized RDD family membrane protein YckC